MDEEKIIPYQDGQENACLEDVEDKRDLIYDEIVAAAPPVKIDWEKGFDIRDFLNDYIIAKCQLGLSCVGQAWSYYNWVKQVIEMMKKYGMDLKRLRMVHKDEVDEISSKAIYSQIFIPPAGGAYIRDGAKLIINWGSLFESIVPSSSTTNQREDFMRDLAWKTDKMDELAKVLQGSKYAVIKAADNMDLFAQAIQENHGVVGGVVGQGGRGWNTENPLPPDPKTGKSIWRHCLYYGAFGTDEKGRFIATPNSWGNAYQNPIRGWKPGNLPGDGWQKLREDYFNVHAQFNPWTYVDKSNIKEEDMITNVKVIKDADSAACGIWLPAISPEALESYCINFGIKVPKKDDDSIDFDRLINGELTLKK